MPITCLSKYHLLCTFCLIRKTNLIMFDLYIISLSKSHSIFIKMNFSISNFYLIIYHLIFIPNLSRILLCHSLQISFFSSTSLNFPFLKVIGFCLLFHQIKILFIEALLFEFYHTIYYCLNSDHKYTIIYP